MSLLGAPAHAQGTGTIRGKVTTAGGTPIPNAQVGLVGATVGALSAKDGGYVIANAPAGPQTLRVRLIGYAPASASIVVPAGGNVTRDIELTAAATALDEVVVTGTAGAARRREVGNSIGTVKLSDTPQPNSDFGSLLAGKLSGVQITGGSGNVGAGKAIRLRGNTSMALSNEPLVYIDGVRVRGDAYPKNWPNTGTDQRSSNVNASPLNDILPDDIERIEVIKGAAATTLYGTDAAPGVIQIFTKRGSQGAAKWQVNLTQGIGKLQQFGTDDAKLLFMDPFLRTASSTDAQVQVSGGAGNNVRYLLSASGNYTEGVLPLDLDRKQTLRANVDFSPAKNLAVNWNSSYTNDYLINTPAGNNAHGITLNAFRRDRNYFASANPDTIRQVLAYKINTGIDRAVMGLTGTWTPLPRFSSRVTMGMDRSAVENRNLRPYGFAAAPLGIISDQRWVSRTASVDWVNNYEQPLFHDQLKATFSFGTQYVNANVSDNTAYSETFPGPSNPTVSSGSIKNAFENRQTVITGGGFAQGLFGFKDRYFLTLGLRVDGNSAFGKNFGLQQYPKISGSWVASDESWWPAALGTSLKLRAAMGEAGRAPGAFDAVQTWNPVGWGGQPAFRPANLGNPDLGPERSKETEAGFDFTALNGRFSVDFTAFNAKTTGALFRVSAPPSKGFLASQLKNVGTLQKSGIEMTVGGKLVDRPWLGVDASVALTTNQSKVVSLGGAAPFQVGASNAFAWVIQGQPAPVVRGKRINNPDALYTPGTPLDTTGSAIFGPSAPTRILNGSLSIRTWKGITISLRGEYQGGAYISENSSFQALSRTVIWPTCFAYYAKVAASQPVTNYENATCVQANTKEDMFIFKADFFKLRDATITVPMGKLIPGTQNSLFVLTAQNLFRRNYGMPMFDPEQSGNDGYSAVARYISEHIPAPAVFMASLRLTY
ncbi:MAG: TonB-dependent receptor [Gemmatimonadetes bacterium]|nr:TonB-dependent receptor [Gemmatimonadota bacterium]